MCERVDTFYDQQHFLMLHKRITWIPFWFKYNLDDTRAYNDEQTVASVQIELALIGR